MRCRTVYRICGDTKRWNSRKEFYSTLLDVARNYKHRSNITKEKLVFQNLYNYIRETNLYTIFIKVISLRRSSEKLITYPRESISYHARTHCNRTNHRSFSVSPSRLFSHLIFPPRDRDIQPLPPFVPHCPRLSGRISRPSGD